VTAELEGRLVLVDDGRRYLRFSVGAEASGSALMLKQFSLDPEAFGPSASGSVELSAEIEVTDENLPLVATFLDDLANKRLNPVTVRAVHAGAEVTVATSTGDHVIVRIPMNPLVAAEAGTQKSATVDSYKKPADGEYYKQGER
jgi:hypothetical protein